jgi:hypothetical protein
MTKPIEIHCLFCSNNWSKSDVFISEEEEEEEEE